MLVFYHQLGDEDCLNMGDRYAVESGCSIISCSYKKVPEISPAAIFADAYCSLKWVIANSTALGID
jgi:acetyl esterase/lipase